jgi:NADH:ubiquinone oxidoreductase subunit E
MGTACHVKGGPRILEAVERDLGIKTGDTTKDMQFSIETVRCLGCCGLAAVMTVGEDIHGNITPAKVSKILKQYKENTKNE